MRDSGCQTAGRCCIAAFLMTVAVTAQAVSVVETNVWSRAMGKVVPVSLVLPDGYGRQMKVRYPVAYLLHGLGGNHREYFERTGKVCESVDKYGFVAVCPDGMVSSWWIDSPVDSKVRYETFVANELVPWVDGHLRTQPERARRALVGASMGGYGAMMIGCAHKDVFGAVYSIHGAVELRPFANVTRWFLAERLDPEKTLGPVWERYSVLERAKNVSNGELELYMVIGSDDQHFLPGNRKLHELFSRNGVAHTYVEIRAKTQDESAHTWAFQAIGEVEVYPRLAAFFNRQESRCGK